jgi:uncharacterized protein YutE (UPF0331/DUF86 family)
VKIDERVIEDKLDTIERNINFLEQYRDTSPESFKACYKDIQAVKFSLLEIIEASIDIANHIISVKGYRRAESYSELFVILKEEGMLSDELAGRLSDMARIRNLLVHRYGDVDDNRVLEIAQNNLEDVISFEKKLLSMINKKEKACTEK